MSDYYARGDLKALVNRFSTLDASPKLRLVFLMAFAGNRRDGVPRMIHVGRRKFETFLTGRGLEG